MLSKKIILPDMTKFKDKCLKRYVLACYNEGAVHLQAILSGSILFRKTDNCWRKVFYRAGHLGKCRKLRAANGRNEMLCFGEYMNQGYNNDRLVRELQRKVEET